MSSANAEVLEERRLRALFAHEIIDTAAEQAFDDLVELAAAVCGTKIALFSVIDDTRQWVKAKVGFPFDELPRQGAFCAHAIESLDPLVVEDARTDERFCRHPWVVDSPHIRFYTGVPLITADGAIGTVCVMDPEPRVLRDSELRALRVIARQVLMHMQWRRTARERARDLEELKRGREALELSERRYRAVVTSMSEGVVLHGRTGEILASNHAAERILGLTADQIAGRTSVDPRWRAVREDGAPFPGGDHPAMVSLRTGRALRDVIMGVHKPDGSLAWISVSAQPIFTSGEREPHAVIATFDDITARRTAELEKAHSEQQLELAMLATGLAVWDWRMDEKTVAFRGSREALLGYDPSELSGSEVVWQAIIHPDDLPFVRAELFEHLEGRTPTYRSERRCRAKDGSWRWVMVTGATIERSSDGRPSRLLGTQVDVTSRRHIEEQLALAERMVSLGSMAAGVAHEINNPLTFVSGNIGAARECLGRVMEEHGASVARGLEPAIEALKDAELGAERVRDVVHDLRALTRPDEGKLTPVNLVEVLESSINIAQHELKHRARVVRDFAVSPTVKGQNARLGQLFVNLLVNAAQAIDQGSQGQNVVVVRTRLSASDEVVVEIEDSGVGIPAEDLPRIFDPYFTTKSHGTGTGLGLSICHRIVRAHHGEISVESMVGKGTKVTIVLPVWTEEIPLPSESTREPTLTAAPRSRRVLVVDDEPAVGRVVRRVLSPEHEVFTEDNVLTAVERIVAGERFDVILCDVVMPELGGREFLARLIRVAPELISRLIFITGGVREASGHDFLRFITNPVLEKPFSAQALRTAVEKCLATSPDAPSAGHP